jgi:hypothetical protein
MHISQGREPITSMMMMIMMKMANAILLGSWPSRTDANMTRAPVSIEPLQLPKVLMQMVVKMMEIVVMMAMTTT